MKRLALVLLLAACRTEVRVDATCGVHVSTEVESVVVKVDATKLVPVLMPMPIPFTTTAEKP